MKMNKENLIKFGIATNNELFDKDYKDGEWMVRAVETHETIDNFVESSKKWVEKSKEKTGEIAGFRFVAWANCQAAKGQPRKELSVVDFGDIRFAIDADLTNFI